MRIQSFNNFKVNEAEIKSLSSLDQYKPIALGVAEVFSLFGYFISLATEKIEESDWQQLITQINSKRGYDEKWNQIINTAKAIMTQLQRYSTEKNKNVGFQYMKLSDIPGMADGLIQALQRLKTASDILIKDLDNEKIQRRLKLIEDAVSIVKPFGLNESLLYEAKLNLAPTESLVLNLADQIASQIVHMSLSLKMLADVYDETQGSALRAEKSIIEPLEKRVKEIIDPGIRPKANLPINRTLKKSYADKGWDIKDQLDQYMVDSYLELKSIEKDVIDAYKRIQEYKSKINSRYSSSSDAGEYIETANRLIQEVKTRILKKMEIARLERKAGDIFAGSSDRVGDGSYSDKLKQEDPLLNADKLRDLLKRKYQTK
jgi:hypothetical protein